MRRFLRRSSLVLLALVAGGVVLDVATYEPASWLADHDRLTRDMAQGYANLDWIAAQRGLDLARLDRTTRARLADAHSNVRAFLAVRDFVAAFGDPHLRIEWGERPAGFTATASAAPATADAGANVRSLASTQAEATPEPPAGASCADAGYGEEDHRFTFPFDRVRGWQALGGGAFPSGRIGDVGVVRIAQFGEESYLSACNAAFVPGVDARTLQLRTRAVLQARLRATLSSLHAAGARRLLVDVSGNGGGSEWVGDVVALLTDRTLDRAEPRVVQPACNRQRVWRGEIPCAVFGPSAGRATIVGAGAWRGPVYVLTDGGTASASEDLVAWLQQNQVATVIGARTMGAGCGYVDGGGRTALLASHFDVRMPNCARFLDDGTNEIEGLAPDVALPMQSAQPQARADELARFLSAR